MESSNLSVYFVYVNPINEFFDSSPIGSYFPLSSSLLVNSLSRLLYDLPDQNFQIMCHGKEEDYALLEHSKNNAYFQFGSGNDELYKISSDQNIKFELFYDIKSLLFNLQEKISNDSSRNIVIILQNQGTHFKLSYYVYIQLLYQISNVEKDILIFDDGCDSGSLIDIFKKNKMLFSYFQNFELENKRESIPYLYYLAAFQSCMFNYFKEYTSSFLAEFVIFLSQVHYGNDIREYYLYDIVNEILKAFDSKNQNYDRIKYFYTPINKNFFDKLKKDSNFDISRYISQNDPENFYDFSSFLKFLQKNNVKTLANLMMIKCYYEFTYDRPFLAHIGVFSKEYYELFFKIEKEIFDLPQPEKNPSIKTTEELNRLKEFYDRITEFFKQYLDQFLPFFDYKSNIEIITSTRHDKSSLSYSFHHPNTLYLASFIRTAFFAYQNHSFNFINFQKHIYFDQTTNQYNYEVKKPIDMPPLIHYSPQHLVYPNEKKTTFIFHPSSSLPKKIAAVRFLTHFVCDYLSKFQKIEYFPNLDFSCGFSKIPSDLLINFITLSILPDIDTFPSDLKLNNEIFLNVLKFAYLIIPIHSMDTSMNKEQKQISINNERFKFTTFFSVVLSSKIRYLIARNLLLILRKQSNFNDFIYLFSIKELELAAQFLKLKHLEKCTDASAESAKLFLTELFSVNFIDQYYSVVLPDADMENSKEFKHLCELKKSPEFNLQKMFLDLESSILNFLPSNVFVFSSIYSYLFLKYHRNLDSNPSILEDVQKIQQTLSKISEEEKFEKINEKLNTFNSLIDILQFCNNFIIKYLQKTFDFLQFFYRSYYIVNFFKVSNQYEEIPNDFENLLKSIEKNIPTNSIQSFFDSLTAKLKPFPLFCLPYIFFDPNSCISYKQNLITFISNFKAVDPNNQSKNGNEFEELPNSSTLFELNYFYSEQFRIHLSNLSLYSELKKSVIESIDMLNKFLDAGNNDVSNFLSLSFFKNSSHSSKTFEFQYQKYNNDKSVIEFCVDTILETHMKKSISNFINEFVSNTTQFLHFDFEKIAELDFKYCNYKDDFQLFFCHDVENKVYIHSILINLMDILNNLSISNPTSTYKNDINEEMHNTIIKLAYLIIEARFNNKVEIDPIVELIPKYEENFSDPRDWNDPTDREFMALCSASPCTLSPAGKFRNRFVLKSSMPKENEEDDDDESCSPLKPIRNYCNEFGSDDYNKPPLILEPIYKKIVDEALNLSEIDIYTTKDKYNIRSKRWSEIVWDVFFDFFNKKLKEIDLNFDTKNDYYSGIGVSLYHENSVINKHFHLLKNVDDYKDKIDWICRFIDCHKKYEYEIKSAYVFSMMSTYEFLKTFYVLDCPY